MKPSAVTVIKARAMKRGLLMRSPSTSVVEDPRSAPFHFRQPGTHPGDTLFVEGLRMSQPNNIDREFSHRPVMLDEIVETLATVPTGVVIDCTLGGAGHSTAILEAHQHLSVLGLDRDEMAAKTATERLARFGDRAQVRSVRFDQMEEAAEDAYPGMPIVGVLFDLGVSSPQLDWAERGFSYRNDGPLDMRMDQRQSLSAETVVNTYDLNRLTDVLRDGGEESFARRIARAIVDSRPINGTVELAEVVRSAIPAPARRKPGDPARRSFQAIRLEVNGELDVLGRALDIALDLLVPGGRLVTLAYHSGEDRLVKQRFVQASTGGCVCPPGLPCGCGATPTMRLLTRGARKPSPAEVQTNPRAEAARMRAVEALGARTDTNTKGES